MEPTPAAYPIAIGLGVLAVLSIGSFIFAPPEPFNYKTVAMVVLGDIGRSPRMLNHATSLIDKGYKVHIIAYRGSTPPKTLVESDKCQFIYLSSLPIFAQLPKFLFLLFAPLKALHASLALAWALWYHIDSSPRYILVQNPPSIPTLPIVQFMARLRGSFVIIDWHNTGHSILALRLGKSNPLVKLAKWIEMTFGRRAYAHLFVSEAMKDHLVKTAHLKGETIVLHDRPPKDFRKQTKEEAHELFSRLPVFQDPELQIFAASTAAVPSEKAGTTLFTTQLADDKVSLLAGRPALLVSATSWTADEDFSVLLEALDSYDKAAQAAATPSTATDKTHSTSLPKIIMIITGKGALKAAFEKKISNLEKTWQFVRVRTSWVESEDYPKLLGSSDLGLSLHSSSSGFDLPMKVVDMFGCGLPVCALDFPSINELVQDDVNGRTFLTAKNLADQLITLLKPFPDDTRELDRLSQGIKTAKYAGENWNSWQENWTKLFAPLLS